MPALPVPPGWLIAVGGGILLLVLVVQMLIGYRKIKFKGRTHLKVHKAVGWLLLLAAVGHGLGGLLYTGILK